MYLSKCSVIFLLYRLSSKRRHQIAFSSTLAVSTVWVVASILVTALRCSLSQPWVIDEKCTSLVHKMFPVRSKLHQLTIDTVVAMADCGRLGHRHRDHDICNVILPDPRSPYGLGKQIHRRWGFWFSVTVSSSNVIYLSTLPSRCYPSILYPSSASTLSTNTKVISQSHPIPNRPHHQLPSPPPLHRPRLHPNILLHLDPNHALHLPHDKHDSLSETPHGGPQHRLRRLRHRTRNFPGLRLPYLERCTRRDCEK